MHKQGIRKNKVIEKLLSSSKFENIKFFMPSFRCTIASQVNGTPKGAYSPILKLHSILAVANLYLLIIT